MKCVARIALAAAVAFGSFALAADEKPAKAPTPAVAKTVVLLRGEGERESAPHGKGNVYAPDVMLDGGTYRMWYGGQGKDGHDRILYAESKGGQAWERKGLALDDPTANHVNDPSVVLSGGTYFMFYTRAGKGVVDEVALATSGDGLTWAKVGTVLSPGKADEWDGLSVGRPSVIVEDGVFKMWYDGRKDLPMGAPADGVPKSPSSSRHVGYATSRDGKTWVKHAGGPVYDHDAGGVDVKRVGDRYLMAYESQAGTLLATSRDGVAWTEHGLWLAKSGDPADAAGHVTPAMLVLPGQAGVKLFFGAAPSPVWNRNAVACEQEPVAVPAERATAK